MALPSGVGRIETLLMQKQIDAERVKLGQESPTQCIERRSSIAALSAADAVISVDLRHLPAGALCRLA